MNTWLGLVSRQYRTGGKSTWAASPSEATGISGCLSRLMGPHNWEKFSFGASNHGCPITTLKTLAAITVQQTLNATRGLDIDERLAQSIG
jgi:hypothetical protein